MRGTLMSIPGARGGKWNRGGRREAAEAEAEVGLKGARLAAAAAKKVWGRGGVWVWAPESPPLPPLLPLVVVVLA